MHALRCSLYALAGVAGLLLVGPMAHANLVLNGGFETADFTGWTLSGNPGFISIVNDAHSGNFAGSFGAVGSPTFLSQDLTTTPGQMYTLDLWLKNLGGPANSFQAQIDSVPLISFADSAPFPYTEFTGTFTATGTTTNLTFAMQQNPSFFHLDDIDVTPAAATPEPGSMALMGGLAMLGTGLLARRRK